MQVFGEINMQEQNGNLEVDRLSKRSFLEDTPRMGRVNRSYSGSSIGSTKGRRASQFLDLPPMVN